MAGQFWVNVNTAQDNGVHFSVSPAPARCRRWARCWAIGLNGLRAIPGQLGEQLDEVALCPICRLNPLQFTGEFRMLIQPRPQHANGLHDFKRLVIPGVARTAAATGSSL
ncbi:hypothetical protein [Burkholderia pseudomallei]|uniref:hypothetical protein n=1 Tax=Burkholderia pseudomallei TaxID=28450 RepID=UPI0013F146FC|nr:hypothetical protein [Burkholderia pseudomallei]